MKVGFEKIFTSIQTGLIALCLEAVSKEVDVVYAYAYIGEGSSMFNVFYKCDDKIFPAHKVIQDRNLLSQVLKYGIDDLERLRAVCIEYETKHPVEMRMCYNCKTKKYNADCVYSTNNTEEFSPVNAFLEWRREISSTGN